MSAWKYADELARYVAVDDVRPAPRAKSRERRQWLARAREDARTHVLRRIEAGIARGTLHPAGSAEKRLAILERAIGGDIEAAVKRRRDLYRQFVQLWVASDAIFRAGLAMRGVSNLPIESAASWAQKPKDQREILPPDPFWNVVLELVEGQHLRVELTKHGVLQKLFELLNALQLLQREWEAPTDPTSVEFVTSERGADPVPEWFASACLREGVGYYEAAMIDGMVHVSPGHVGDTWFDDPNGAVRRWRGAFGRLFARCLEPRARVRRDGPPRRVAAIGQVPLIDADLRALGKVLGELTVATGSTSQPPPSSNPCRDTKPKRRPSTRRS